MLIHSDTLTVQHILGAVPSGCELVPFNHPGFGVTRVGQNGSKTHARKFSVLLSGSGKGNIWSSRLVNPERSATWDEYGNFIAALYRIDPEAKIGHYANEDDFMRQTDAEHERIKRYRPEDLPTHSAPWLNADNDPADCDPADCTTTR